MTSRETAARNATRWSGSLARVWIAPLRSSERAHSVSMRSRSVERPVHEETLASLGTRASISCSKPFIAAKIGRSVAGSGSPLVPPTLASALATFRCANVAKNQNRRPAASQSAWIASTGIRRAASDAKGTDRPHSRPRYFSKRSLAFRAARTRSAMSGTKARRMSRPYVLRTTLISSSSAARSSEVSAGSGNPLA